MHNTVVIGSVITDVYRLVNKVKNEKNLDANIREKGNCCLSHPPPLVNNM